MSVADSSSASEISSSSSSRSEDSFEGSEGSLTSGETFSLVIDTVWIFGLLWSSEVTVEVASVTDTDCCCAEDGGGAAASPEKVDTEPAEVFLEWEAVVALE